jgi:hypothetical protein
MHSYQTFTDVVTLVLMVHGEISVRIGDSSLLVANLNDFQSWWKA